MPVGSGFLWMPSGSLWVWLFWVLRGWFIRGVRFLVLQFVQVWFGLLLVPTGLVLATSRAIWRSPGYLLTVCFVVVVYGWMVGLVWFLLPLICCVWFAQVCVSAPVPDSSGLRTPLPANATLRLPP